MVVINDLYFVEVDSFNYTLKRKAIGKNKQGEEIETAKIVGYYSSLKKAILGALEDDYKDKLREGDISLKDAVKAIDDSIKEFTRLLEEIVKA